jgi:hypothetical protein
MVGMVGALILSSGCSSAGAPLEVEDLLPGLNVHPLESEAQSAASYVVERFAFTSQDYDWPYGNGFEIRDASGHLLWLYVHNGDYPPHPAH